MVLVIILLLTTIASGQEVDSRITGKNLSLDIYLYNTGNALVAGYADSLDGLTFLKPARYTLNNTTQYTSKYAFDHQLYAWTDALTMKHGEDWNLTFSCLGFYYEYHIIFHLPANLRLGRINSSKGLKYMVSTSNDSLVVDAQAYYAKDPAITIEYQQSLKELPPTEISSGNRSPNNLLLIAASISILTIGSTFAFIMMKRKKKTSPCEKVIPGPEAELGGMPLTEIQLEEKKEIEISSEMKAIMDTLTPRERSIIDALIKHGGRITQAEIRYETNMPRSSLTMILISLERRNLITKKERGRTNVVELSEWFLSRK